LIEGVKKLKKEEAGKASLVLYIAGYPVLGLCLVSWIFQYGMFQFRAVLFGLFLMAFLASYLVWDLRQRGKKAWILLLVLVFWLQIGSWYDYRSHAAEDPYRAMAGIVKRHYKPGDGIVIIPGFHYLPFFRYYKPDLFAITPEEQHFDPNRENLYNMVNHIDQDYFFVSGRVIRDSQVLKQFLAFQNSHNRLWFLGQLEFTPFFTCGKTYLTIDDLSSDAIMEHRCFQDVQVMNQQSGQHLGFCHRRVGQEQWLCDR
jgi:hypothetical protein